MSLIVRPTGIQPAAATGTTRRGFLRAVGAGTALLTTGCGDVPVLYPDQKILSLSERLTNLLSMDPRFHLYVEGKSSPINTFLAYCETNWGDAGIILIVSSLEKATDAVIKIESQLKTTYHVEKFAPEIRFQISTSILDTIMAKADPFFISISPPKPSGFATTALYVAMVAHEYGHFLSFLDRQGNLVVTSSAGSYATDMAEMNTKGYLERYHLKDFKFLPWLSSALSWEEYNPLSELLADKVATTLVGKQEMSLLYALLEKFSLEQLMGSTPKAAFLVYFIYQAKKHKLTTLENLLMTELSKPSIGLSQQELSSALLKLDAFYNSVKLLDH